MPSTIQPIVTTSLQHTNAPSVTETTIDCELIGLFISLSWNTTSSNYSLYKLFNQNQKRFDNLIEKSIYIQYHENNDDGFIELELLMKQLYGSMQSSNMNISYNITNCNQQIDSLAQYLNANEFMEDLSNDINHNYYYNSQNNFAMVTSTHTEQYHTFLAQPIHGYDILSINNPVTLGLSAIIALLTFIMCIGCMHNNSPIKCNQFCGCKIIDNFRWNRMFSYLFNTAIFMISLNILYT
eukprot:235876_1